MSILFSRSAASASTLALAVSSLLPAAPAFAAASADTGGDQVIVVTADRTGGDNPTDSNAIVDSIGNDDLETIAGGDGSIAEQLIKLPGVAGIEEGDSPRFVSIRGIAPNLNSTLIDGITIATIGNDGEGSRQVNLQLLPAQMSRRNDIYKSFTPEQPGDAIGGVIDMVTRSAFTRKKPYVFLDGYGIYSTYRGPAHINDVGGSGSHWGGGIKGAFADSFGPGKQFGIVLTAQYQNRIRNAAKRWQDTKYYFSDAGKKLGGPDDPDWNGLVVPYNHSYGSYTNQLRSWGGSAKLEWRNPDESLYVSVLGFGFHRGEISTMNKQDFYTKNAVYDQTAEGGRSQINSIYTRYRYDNWDRGTFGGLGNIDWHQGRSHLQLRGGHTKAVYDNVQPYLAARTYPKSAYLTYSSGQNSDGLPQMESLSDATVLDPTQTVYKSSTVQTTYRHAREDVSDIRLDYGFNSGPDARGAGFAFGAEWRRLNLRRDLDLDIYAIGQNMTAYLFDPGYMPQGATSSIPWVNYAKFRDEQWSGLTRNEADSAYESAVSDYRYIETIVTPYFSLHYATDDFLLVWGLRDDHTRFHTLNPLIDGGVVQSGMKRQKGGYDFLLPSLSAEYRFAPNSRITFAASRTLGRPTPGDVAKPESVSCGDTEDGGEACVISRGNPDLRPRRSTNLDLSVRHAFNHNRALIGAGLFAKWIADDIFTLTSQTVIDDTVYRTKQPLNADKSKLVGGEFQVISNDMKLAGLTVDGFFNLTVLKGRMGVTTDTGERTLHRMLYQPKFLANAGVTVRLPQIDGAVRATYNYRGKYMDEVGSTAADDTGRAGYGTLNLALWHKIAKHVSLKYEIVNLFNEQPKFLMGDNLRYVSEIDDYGRGIYAHLIIR